MEETEPSSNFEEEEQEKEIDNVSYKSFNSSSFETDLSDINNEAKKFNKTQYMREYMRNYRQKQKQNKQEHSHCCIIRNKFYQGQV